MHVFVELPREITAVRIIKHSYCVNCDVFSLDVFAGTYCSICNISIESILMVRFTISEHYNDSVPVRRGTLADFCIRKLHAVVRCCRTRCTKVVHLAFQSCCSAVSDISQILHYLGVIISISPLRICIIAYFVSFISGKLDYGYLVINIIL